MGQRSLAKAVYCPKCDASPGQNCFKPDGSIRISCHRERHSKAKAWRAKQKAKPKASPNQVYLDQVEWAKRRAEVFAVKGSKCHYCGEAAWHVDHVVPRVHGGTDDLDNLVPACGPCNMSKGSTLYEGKRE